jgi:hypothetical protein
MSHNDDEHHHHHHYHHHYFHCPCCDSPRSRAATRSRWGEDLVDPCTGLHGGDWVFGAGYRDVEPMSEHDSDAELPPSRYLNEDLDGEGKGEGKGEDGHGQGWLRPMQGHSKDGYGQGKGEDGGKGKDGNLKGKDKGWVKGKGNGKSKVKGKGLYNVKGKGDHGFKGKSKSKGVHGLKGEGKGKFWEDYGVGHDEDEFGWGPWETPTKRGRTFLERPTPYPN